MHAGLRPSRILCSASYYHPMNVGPNSTATRKTERNSYVPPNANADRRASSTISFPFSMPLRYAGYIADPGVSGCILSSVYQIIYTKENYREYRRKWVEERKWNWGRVSFSAVGIRGESQTRILPWTTWQSSGTLPFNTKWLSRMIAYGADHCSREKYLKPVMVNSEFLKIVMHLKYAE